jgi:hypothetical protein
LLRAYEIVSPNPCRLKKSLLNHLTGRQARHLNTLAAFVYGVVQGRQVKLSAIAGELQNRGKEESRIMQFRRFLANEALNHSVYYLPFIMAIVRSLVGQPLVLAIDGSVTGRGCVTLMVSLVYRRRALPLLWVTRQGKKGRFPEKIHVELIKAVQAILPPRPDVIVLGDGEFDGTEWLAAITGKGWRYACRTAKDSVFHEGDDDFRVQDICPARGKCTGIDGLRYTAGRYGPVMAVAWWGRGYQDPIYLVSNFGLPEEACRWYRKRFRIETMFSDFKGRGFQLQKSGLTNPAKIERLLIVVALAYVLVVYFGLYALRHQWHKIIHRTERCDLSLFEMGKRLIKRFETNRISFPSLYLPDILLMYGF